MRIGLVCPYSLTVPGGVQQQVLNLADALRHDHDVRIIAPSDGSPPPGAISIGSSWQSETNGSLAPVAAGPRAQLRTISALLEGAYDLVHLHEPLCPGPTLTGLILQPAPLVGTFYAAGGSAGYRLPVRPVLRALARRLSHRCAVSLDAAALAEQWLAGHYEIVFAACSPPPPAVPMPKPDVPAVFFCARHEPRKGLRVLLEAFEAVTVDCQLWIASSGPETAELRARWPDSERISWLGRISEVEKAARMTAASLICVPSLRSESFGVVLLEAMAHGTPLVASDLPAHARVVSHGQEGLLSLPGDAQALAISIDKVLGDRELARTLGEKARRRSSQYSVTRLAGIYDAIYRDVYSRRDVSR